MVDLNRLTPFHPRARLRSAGAAPETCTWGRQSSVATADPVNHAAKSPKPIVVVEKDRFVIATE